MATLSKFGTFWKDIPVVGWAFDDEESLASAIGRQEIDDKYQSYTSDFLSAVNPLLTQSSSFTIDFGGASNKNKLIAIDRPLGVFNFALASKTLYKKIEYYSEELAKEQPDKFKYTEKQSGIVPPNLVNKATIGSKTNYYYKDPENNKEYVCIQQQDGTEAIKAGISGAVLKYGSRTKKVYNTYNRKGGKVKYVEIYSLYYFTSLSGETQFAIRHLPALMVANYLESIGIQTRIYITRFVKLFDVRIKAILRNGQRNPLYEMLDPALKGKKGKVLFIQPMPAKNYGDDLDLQKILMYGTDSSQFYAQIASNGISQEALSSDVFGNPDFSQEAYLEGFERYRQKYIQYTRNGIWRAKEVTAQGMIFFHDMSIKRLLSSFVRDARNAIGGSWAYVDALLNTEVNPFFNWWMVSSANTIKHKIDLLNSDNRVATIKEIDAELQSQSMSIDSIINDTSNNKLRDVFTQYRSEISDYLKLNDVYSYVDLLLLEMSTYAEGNYFPTPQESIDERNEFQENVLKDMIYV